MGSCCLEAHHSLTLLPSPAHLVLRFQVLQSLFSLSPLQNLLDVKILVALASGWDLGKMKHYPLTGFSGTTDSKDVRIYAFPFPVCDVS